MLNTSPSHIPQFSSNSGSQLTECSPQAVAQIQRAAGRHELFVHRAIALDETSIFEAATDPWTLLVLHSAGKTNGLDDAPFRLRENDSFEFRATRFGIDLDAKIQITGFSHGSLLEWTTSYSHNGNEILSGETWSLNIAPLPNDHCLVSFGHNWGKVNGGTWARFLGHQARVHSSMTLALRHFDVLLTRTGSQSLCA